MADYGELMKRVGEATAGDRRIDDDFAHQVLGWTYEKRKGDAKPYWRRRNDDWRVWNNMSPKITESVDAANEAAKMLLPLWWISSGQCSLGPHASIGPDGRSHEAAGVPYPEQFDSGFHWNFKHPAPEACARLVVILMALQALQAQTEKGR